jgi:hypothetical protein
MERYPLNWQNPTETGGLRYVCGYCGVDTSPSRGFHAVATGGISGYILLCTGCNRPSFIEREGGTIARVTPSPKKGNVVKGLPSDVGALYDEARGSTGANANTGAVLLCRKILMHIAVEKGADKNLSFLQYVEFLAVKGYVAPDARGWVDYIRTKSNEANHELVLMTPQDADDLLTFTEMLLRQIYEFKTRLPAPPTPEPHQP